MQQHFDLESLEPVVQKITGDSEHTKSTLSALDGTWNGFAYKKMRLTSSTRAMEMLVDHANKVFQSLPKEDQDRAIEPAALNADNPLAARQRTAFVISLAPDFFNAKKLSFQMDGVAASRETKPIRLLGRPKDGAYQLKRTNSPQGFAGIVKAAFKSDLNAEYWLVHEGMANDARDPQLELRADEGLKRLGQEKLNPRSEHSVTASTPSL